MNPPRPMHHLYYYVLNEFGAGGGKGEGDSSHGDGEGDGGEDEGITVMTATFNPILQ
ncbi:hypothetical protein L195_g025083 [Trifolium pratense]|uniref:Uncharacterized protein n=1 Tax=Trifolium pratense TaxID=57577 RepID=A0A2K3NFH6_TRIPR|nr:hypothetical protein L195_g025083 [Trifolium pratense]